MPKKENPSRPKKSGRAPAPLYKISLPPLSDDVFLHATPVDTAPFVLREDGAIVPERGCVAETSRSSHERKDAHGLSQTAGKPGHAAADAAHTAALPRLAYRDDARGLWLYHGNSLELLDAIFADPPYFLSNGGISCHACEINQASSTNFDSLTLSACAKRASLSGEIFSRPRSISDR